MNASRRSFLTGLFATAAMPSAILSKAPPIAAEPVCYLYETVPLKWFADGIPIANATGNLLRLTDDMIGKRITCKRIWNQGA